MPDPKAVKVGVWENHKFIGCVIFSRGVACTAISKTLGIKSTEIAELSRVALSRHESKTSRIVAIALRMLKSKDKGLRVVVSYADENQNHLGILYQAGNWIYTGQSASSPLLIDASGRQIHSRSCSASGLSRQFGSLKRVRKLSELHKISQKPKWRYFYPLDISMRQTLERVRKPYPKRCAGSDTLDTLANHAGEGGSLPTPALPLSTEAEPLTKKKKR